ncbi:MAG: zf-HC2 domain-containing protein [Burkholderiaceae bacterium]|jgi:predicted anti-sigma-YlaC factor YlaD|nr:zf-HC2 domain-containing protein [Aquabacterium sp.]NUP84480.1 zf-HC2 domain-containing protein [Burkholderiaceae bacterium]
MKWTYSCRRVAELLSQRLDEPLGLLDEIRLKLHLSMCGNCANVAAQIDAVHAASSDLLSTGLELDEPTSHPPPR